MGGATADLLTPSTICDVLVQQGRRGGDQQQIDSLGAKNRREVHMINADAVSLCNGDLLAALDAALVSATPRENLPRAVPHGALC